MVGSLGFLVGRIRGLIAKRLNFIDGAVGDLELDRWIRVWGF